MSSELRQRRGAEKEAKGTSDGDAGTEELRQEVLSSLQQVIKDSAPAVGLTHRAKACKDRLTMDPYNLQYIHELGAAYALDNWWSHAENVLIRGWKRVDEFKDPVTEFEFLMLLAECSYKNKKYRQAAAVIGSVKEPIPEQKCARDFQARKARVLAASGDAQKALATFNAAIKGQSFDDAMAVWSTCVGEFKKAGVADPAKTVISAMAKGNEQIAKIDACEKVAASMMALAGNDKEAADPSRKLNLIGLAVCSMIFLVCLYFLEQHSLKRFAQK